MRFSDFRAGQVIDCGTRSVTEEEIVAFGEQYDPQPFHVARESEAARRWGGLIASGWHTCSLAMELVVKAILVDSDSVGSPGVEAIRWDNPVREGDELHLKVYVIDSHPSSSGRYGVVKWRWEMRNQRDQPVLELTTTSLFDRAGQACSQAVS
jgi:acyl dehydratase